MQNQATNAFLFQVAKQALKTHEKNQLPIILFTSA